MTVKDIINQNKTKLQTRMNDMVFIWEFSVEDFKAKYAGSALGCIWAFLQPMITIVLYWFVFQLGFRSHPVDEFPFILWLMTGLVPWFFLNEAVVSAAVSLVEYSYLVKKVLFNINILPLVKILSALFVHMALIVFTILFFVFFGYMPELGYWRLSVYLLYMVIFVSGMSYLASAVYVFFRDAIQIINIIFQILFWTTPIVWNIQDMPEVIQSILVFNPLYYIVDGYRNVFIFHNEIQQPLEMTMYYWGFAVILLLVGKKLFDRCKDHFADVL